jgi:hypothetical protein
LRPYAWPVLTQVDLGVVDGHPIHARTALVPSNAFPRTLEILSVAYLLVMFNVTNPCGEGEHAMTRAQTKQPGLDLKSLLASDGDFLRTMMDVAVQAVLEAEMTEALSAEKSARVDGRQGYRSGYYSRSLVTRVGTLELRVPRDRSGLFSTALFERYQRSEKALVSALAEMYVQGVSTRKIKEVTETLCGHSFSATLARPEQARPGSW